MVNILVMNVSFLYRGEWEAEQTGWLQRGTLFVMENLFYSKFFTIFSFLFGIGVALQLDRARKSGNYSSAFFIRRFGALFLFGVLHILLIWAGDILHLYGLMGFGLLFFFRASAKTLLWSSIVVFLFPFYTPIFEQIMTWLSFDHAAPLAELSRDEILELKHHGSYLSGMILRLKEYAFVMGFVYSGISPVAFSMMLLGGCIVKSGWMENLYERILQVRPYFLVSLLVLLVYRFTLIYYIIPNFEVEAGSALSIALMTFYQLSDIGISLSLLWSIGLLWHQGFSRMLSPLRFVGRMALTNYILQSMVGYLIMRTFKGYEYFSPFGCVLVVLGVFVIQVAFSKWWLEKFRFGPLEWAWRCISYRKRLPIIKSPKPKMGRQVSGL